MSEFTLLPHVLKLLPPADGFIRHTSDARANSKDVYGRTALDILHLTAGADSDFMPGLREAVELLQGLGASEGLVNAKVLEDHDSRDSVIYELSSVRPRSHTEDDARILVLSGSSCRERTYFIELRTVPINSSNSSRKPRLGVSQVLNSTRVRGSCGSVTVRFRFSHRGFMCLVFVII
jgi:hypothetical protein